MLSTNATGLPTLRVLRSPRDRLPRVDPLQCGPRHVGRDRPGHAVVADPDEMFDRALAIPEVEHVEGEEGVGLGLLSLVLRGAQERGRRDLAAEEAEDRLGPGVTADLS